MVYMQKAASKKIISVNRKARHNYIVEKTYEAGIELVGTEVKSLRNGAVNLKDSYCIIDNGQIYILNMHISPYENGNIFNRDPIRKRKLLMHKQEILNLYNSVKLKGYSLIPLSIYFSKSKVKIELGFCKGKKIYDKRADMAAKDAKRQMERAKKQSLNY